MGNRSGDNPWPSSDTKANAKFEYHQTLICIASGELGTTLSDLFS
jgi:hypothetical protein